MVVRRLPASDELTHHGILGQKWGVRRYQNADGSLTNVGKKRKGLVQTIKDKKKAKMLREAKAKKKAEREERAEIIKSGNIRKIEKIKSSLTKEEIKLAMDRIDFNEKLNTAKVTRGKNYIDIISKTGAAINNVGKGLNTAITVGKTIASMMENKAD
jgi:hypothetical protein